MKYIGYVFIALAGLAGFFGVRVIYVLGLALVAALAFIAARQQAVREVENQIKPGRLSDGIFLVAQQFLIVFAVYLLGYLMRGLFERGAIG